MPEPIAKNERKALSNLPVGAHRDPCVGVLQWHRLELLWTQSGGYASRKPRFKRRAISG